MTKKRVRWVKILKFKDSKIWNVYIFPEIRLKNNIIITSCLRFFLFAFQAISHRVHLDNRGQCIVTGRINIVEYARRHVDRKNRKIRGNSIGSFKSKSFKSSYSFTTRTLSSTSGEGLVTTIRRGRTLLATVTFRFSRKYLNHGTLRAPACATRHQRVAARRHRVRRRRRRFR